MRTLVFGNSGSGKSTLAQRLAQAHGLATCLAHNRLRAWKPHKYASKEAQDAMLADLQAWVAGDYERQDAWSYRALVLGALYRAGTRQAWFQLSPGAA